MPKSMAFVKKILLVVSMIKKEANAFTKNGTDKGRLSAHKVVAGATVGRLQMIIVVQNG